MTFIMPEEMERPGVGYMVHPYPDNEESLNVYLVNFEKSVDKLLQVEEIDYDNSISDTGVENQLIESFVETIDDEIPEGFDIVLQKIKQVKKNIEDEYTGGLISKHRTTVLATIEKIE